MNSEAIPSLPQYLRILWRRKWALLVPLLAATAAAYGLAKSQPPVYEAYTDLLFRGSSTAGGGPLQLADVPTEQRVATSPAVATQAATRLDSGIPQETILAGVAAHQVEQLPILRISVRAPTSAQAAEIVTAVSAAYLDFRRERSDRSTQVVTAALSRQNQKLSEELRQLDVQIKQRQGRGGGSSAEGGAAGATDPDTQALQARRDLLLGQLAVNQGRIDQIGLEAATEGQDVSVLVPASSSGVPVEPKPLRTAAIGALLGLFIGFGLMLLGEQLNRGVRSVDELEQTLGASVRSTIPRVTSWRRTKDARLVMVEDSLSPTAEAYRILQSSLAFLEVGTPSKRVILLTSAAPGEGKSTTAANLAIAFAEAGMRTALIDADLRHPRLHKFFKVPNRAGLSDILTGRATFEEVVHAKGWHESPSGLALLTAGRALAQPTKVLTSNALVSLLSVLRSRDVVIVDAPPTLPVADAGLLAAHADAVLIVSNTKVSSRAALEQLGRRLPSLGAPVLGVVLNAPEPSRLGGDDYTYHYAYAASDTEIGRARRAGDRSRRRRHLHTSRRGDR